MWRSRGNIGKSWYKKWKKMFNNTKNEMNGEKPRIHKRYQIHIVSQFKQLTEGTEIDRGI